jgi:hypothetical protein
VRRGRRGCDRAGDALSPMPARPMRMPHNLERAGTGRDLRVDRVDTPSGRPTITVNGTLMHSRYDPVREAERQAAEIGDASVLVLLSPGLGYLADAAKAGARLIIERHPEIAALRPDLPILVAPRPQTVEEALGELPGWETGRIAIYSGVTLEDDRAWYDEIRGAVERAMDRRVEEVATTRAFADLWERNLAGNSGLFREAGRVKEISWIPRIAHRFSGRAVIVLAAGPSLAGDLEVLARWRVSGRAPYAEWLADPLVLAVDSALPAALAAGIRPDACVTIDPQPVKAGSLTGLGDIPLLASVLSPPAILQRASELYLFGQGHPSEARYGIPTAAIVGEIGGSVATAAATLAVRYGATAVVLSGQDLAITEGITHVKGTHHERGIVEGLNRFGSQESALRRTSSIRRLRRRPGVDGTEVATTPVMDSYRLYFEDLAGRHPAVRFVQTSPHGLRIGVEHAAIGELLVGPLDPADRVT